MILIKIFKLKKRILTTNNIDSIKKNNIINQNDEIILIQIMIALIQIIILQIVYIGQKVLLYLEYEIEEQIIEKFQLKRE